MRIKFKINVSGKLERTYDKNNPNCREFAYHEAGHATVALLSENFIPTILFTDDLKKNCSFCYSHNKNKGSQYNNSIERVFIDFGGKAGASIGVGPLTLGCNLDLREAWKTCIGMFRKTASKTCICSIRSTIEIPCKVNCLKTDWTQRPKNELRLQFRRGVVESKQSLVRRACRPSYGKVFYNRRRDFRNL